MKLLALGLALALVACGHQNPGISDFDEESLAATRLEPANDFELPKPDIGSIVEANDSSFREEAIGYGVPRARSAPADVVSIDARGVASEGDAVPAETDGPRGGPDDDENGPTIADYDPTLWLELPQTPSVLMLSWPLPATGVTSAFGERPDPIDGDTRFHYGLDLEAQYGQVVKSAAAGRVAISGMNHGHGRQVVITHAGGYQTGYSHLAQTMVYEGQIVEAGEAIGLVGTSGRTTGPHLHFEVSRWGSHVDPLSVLGIALKLR